MPNPLPRDLAAVIEKIQSNTYKEKIISLPERGIDQEGVKALAEALKECSHNIKKIDLSGNDIGSKGCEYLFDAKIEVLDLADNPIGSGARAFSNSEHITELSLASCEITDTDAQEVFKNKKLKKLNLFANNLGKDAVLTIPIDSELNELILARNNIGDEGADFLARNNKKIEKLNLSSNKIKNIGVKNFSEHPELVELNLTKNEIGAEGFCHLLESKSIKELVLSHNKISFKEKEEIPQNSSLVTLDLSYNQLEDQKHVLESLASITTLRTLNLEGNSIDKEGREALFNAKKDSLTHINLSHNVVATNKKQRL